jgi:Ni/Co efflux regulator RcnB
VDASIAEPSFSYRGRSHDRFRAQPYRWPRGVRGGYAWRPHQRLPAAFLLRDYFINNYYDFGFGRPPYGYEWVRVGDDALLVNIYTGEILEVAPGVFYW